MASGGRWTTTGGDQLGPRTVKLVDLAEPLRAMIGSEVTIATAVGMHAAATGREVTDAEVRLRSFSAAQDLPVVPPS